MKKLLFLLTILFVSVNINAQDSIKAPASVYKIMEIKNKQIETLKREKSDTTAGTIKYYQKMLEIKNFQIKKLEEEVNKKRNDENREYFYYRKNQWIPLYDTILNNKITEAQKVLDQKKKDLEAKEKELSDIGNKITDSNSKNQEIESKNQELKAVSDKITEAQKVLDQKKKELEDLNTKITEANKKNQETANLSNNIAELQKNLDSKKQELDSKKTELDELNAKIAEANKKNQELQSKNQELNSKLQKLDEQIADQEIKNNELKKIGDNIAELNRNAIYKSTETMSQLSKDIEAKTKELDSLNNKIIVQLTISDTIITYILNEEVREFTKFRFSGLNRDVADTMQQIFEKNPIINEDFNYKKKDDEVFFLVKNQQNICTVEASFEDKEKILCLVLLNQKQDGSIKIVGIFNNEGEISFPIEDDKYQLRVCSFVKGRAKQKFSYYKTVEKIK